MKAKNKQPRNLARLTEDDDGYNLRLYGVVGDDWDGFTDDSVADLLAGVPVGGINTVHLNSPGGTIYQGMAVFSQLKTKKPKVIVVDGLAASMGSVIALAGERLEMTRGSMLMIHNPWNVAMGDAAELRKTADILDKFKSSLIDIYAERTGHERDVLSDMMDEETWLTAEEAVEWGFADGIVDSDAEMSIDLTILKDTKNMPREFRAQLSPAAEAAPSPTQEDPLMSNNSNTPSAAENTPVDNTEALNKAREEAVAAERKRVQFIRDYTAKAEGVQASFGEKLIEDGASEAEAKAAIDRLAEYLAEHTGPISNRTTVEVTRDEKDTLRAGVAQALMNRYNPGAYKIEGDSPARQFAHMRLMDVAREICAANNIATRGKTPQEIAKAALHTTSDFPAITENIVGKLLRDSYDLSPRTFTAISRQATLPDFKEVSRAQFGEAPKLAQVLEGGEYTYGTIGDAAEKYKLFKYGKIVAVTWETLINDDLDAFTRVPSMMGASAGQLESDLFWAHFTGNPTMHDNVALFHANHGNLAAAPAVISVTSLGAGREAMRKQKGLDGEHLINVQARSLVVPAALETIAEQFISTNILPNTNSQVNPFAGRLQVVSEPRLDANSTQAWYLFADPAVVDTLEYAYLQGEEGPQVETKEGFDRDGIAVKVRHCFAAKAIDWRGVYKNAGASS